MKSERQGKGDRRSRSQTAQGQGDRGSKSQTTQGLIDQQKDSVLL